MFQFCKLLTFLTFSFGVINAQDDDVEVFNVDDLNLTTTQSSVPDDIDVYNVVNFTYISDLGERIMYTGPLIDFLPNGEGVGYGLNKDGEVTWVYEGSWKNGLQDGYGELTYPDRPNYYYKGGYKEGRRDGEGERRDDDGTITKLTPVKDEEFDYNCIRTKSEYLLPMEQFRYTGQVNSDGKPDGYGLGDVFIFGLFWAGGYIGFWRNGYPDGFGLLKAADQGPLAGGYYKGDWIDGGMIGNSGVFRYPGGATYEGIFNKDGPVYGTLTYKNGDKFTGMFENFNEKDGFGTYTWSNGKVYSGPFVNGSFDSSEMNVPGFLFHPIGKYYEGLFSNGIATGIHQVTLPDGTQSEICTSSDGPGSWNYILCEDDEIEIFNNTETTTESETGQTVK